MRSTERKIRWGRGALLLIAAAASLGGCVAYAPPPPAPGAYSYGYPYGYGYDYAPGYYYPAPGYGYYGPPFIGSVGFSFGFGHHFH